MNFSVFFQTFYLCFLVLISVGPVFITTANLSMTRGYKVGFFCILGCVLADFIFITAGALCAKAVIALIPQSVIMFLSLFAGCFLLHIAYGFWKTDISKIKTQKINKTNFALSLKMFCLTLSSPLSIIGYGAIFSSVVDVSKSMLSAILGGCCAACFTHTLIVVCFGTLGKKINTKILSILNKISAILISCFASLLVFNFVKTLINTFIGK